MTDKNHIEFFRPIALQSIGDKGHIIGIEATSEECHLLALRLGLNELISLSANLCLTLRKGGRIINLKGFFQAKVMQTCVVTLDSLSNEIEGSLDVLYNKALKKSDKNLKSIDIDCNSKDRDTLELLTEGQIDVGEAVSEQLALEIDPFPRKLGVSFVQFSTETKNGTIVSREPGEGPIEKRGHFSELAELKERLKNTS